MPRVKIEDIKPPAKDLDVKEMKKLYGGLLLVHPNNELTPHMSHNIQLASFCATRGLCLERYGIRA
jgi:hypothetical protein